MTYNDYRTHLLTCEYLNREPTGQYKKLHDFLTGLWENMECVVHSWNNSIFFQKGDGWFIVQDLKNGDMWCQTDSVWSFFRTDMDMELTERQDFIKSAVDEHLKCKVETPPIVFPLTFSPVDEHLKCKVETPRGLPRTSFQTY
jgi:hypothetical protein